MADQLSAATASARPPLVRGNTAPAFLRTTSSHDQQRIQQEVSFASHVDRNKLGTSQSRLVTLSHKNPLLLFFVPLSLLQSSTQRYCNVAGNRQAENTTRREQPTLTQGNSISSNRPTNLRGMPAHPPTPPLSTSPGSAGSCLEDAYFPVQQMRSSNSVSSQHRTKPSPLHVQGSLNGSVTPIITSPTVSETSSSLQFMRNSRSSAPQQSAPMHIDNTLSEYVLSAAIGPGFDSSCITITARKGSVLNIVADRWDMEKDCTFSYP